MPMRAIPLKCVFAGHERWLVSTRYAAAGFDLMANQPRKGDRSRREDDRYLF